MTDQATGDFIFGTLATDELRLDALRAGARGVTHGTDIDPMDPRPGEPVTVRVSTGPTVNATRVVAHYTLDGTEPTAACTTITFQRTEPVWDTLPWAYRDMWEGTLPAHPDGTLVRYHLVATAPDGTETGADLDPWTGEPETFAYHVDELGLPGWARVAVIYHIFVDRFWPGDDRDWNDTDDLNGFWGGTIRGVIDKLPYLEALGVTCLWLSPVFPSPSHHGYDATDYFTVEPRLGTEADLVTLFEAAHTRGMRVLLDFVANHVSNEHPLFDRATTDAESDERRWFTFKEWPDKYRSFFGVKSLPQLNTDEPDAREYLFEAAAYWLERGADGFRLDYANGPTHAFWAEFRGRTRATQPESLTIGEVVETAELQRSYRGRLDGCLDFLLLQHIRAYLAFGTITTREFDAFLQRHLRYFPANFILPSFLDNHDMNRFLWAAGGDIRKLKLAALLQFTLPYPPVVYYGTEVGLSQWHDVEHDDGSLKLEESRTPMIWGDGQDHDLLNYYKRLIAFRREYASLLSGARETTVADDDGMYIVRCIVGERALIVAINASEQEHHWDGDLPAIVVVASNNAITCDSRGWFFPPFSGAVFNGPL
ncbi:MAG: glycoside hydrolase family 13 protein [Thermomicrobiales bacterium]